MANYVTLRVYDTVLEATEAEHQLARGGIAGVRRSGMQVQVDAIYAGQARAVLAGSAPSANPGATGASVASDTAHHAASPVGDTAQHVLGSAAETVQDAASTVTTQASKVTRVAADRVQDVADSIRQSGSSPDASGVQRQATQTTAGMLDKASQYIGPGGVQTLVGDVRSSIQRHPLRSLVLGVGVGYLLRARYVPVPPATTTSTPPAQPSTPTLQPTPPSYGAVRTQPEVDVLGSDTLMDDSLSGDLLDTSSMRSTRSDADLGSMRSMDDSTFIDSSPTTPLSTDDLDTTVTDDASNAGTTDLGDLLSRWDERTRGEGSPS